MGIGDLINRVTGGGREARSAFEPTRDDERLWDEYVREALALANPFETDHAKLPAARTILDTSGDHALARLLLAGARRFSGERSALARIHSLLAGDSRWRLAMALKPVVSGLLRRNLPLDAPAVAELLRLAADNGGVQWVSLPQAGVIRAAERFAARQPLTDEHRQSLSKLCAFMKGRNDAEARKLVTRIDALLADPANPSAPPPVQIKPGEAWSDAALRDLGTPIPPAWAALLAHCRRADGSKPSRKWLTRTKELIDDLGAQRFTERTAAWFALVGQPGTPTHTGWGTTDATLLGDENADLLKGLAWSCAASPSPDLTRALGDLAEACFKKVPGVGPRNAKVGNAAVVALSLLTSPDAVAQLGRVRSRVKHASARATVERALGRSAEKLGVSADEVEGLTAPTLGLSPDASLARTIGDYTARFRVLSAHETELTWQRADGKTQKSAPAELKASRPAELKELKRLGKDVRTLLPAQRDRIERMLRDERSFTPERFRANYLDHSLLSVLTRRLIWDVSQGGHVTQAIWFDGRLVNAAGEPLTDLAPDAAVSLWHPIDSPADAVLAWRRFLDERRITQPFKQAHREIYLLTDAERQTGTYSNRFAGHILRQHQFAALCQARGWTYRLMGNFDSHNTPTLPLPRHDLQAEFWVEYAGNGGVSGAGIALQISTDQVRFCRPPNFEQALPLDRVPPKVFSEVMRDVDLFTGVTSIAADPNWQDGGEQPHFLAYWRAQSFGDLSETAKTRRAVLESLLPRLTQLRGKWSLADRFLVVQGTLRTYKIHLGSGNILMDPNDQYLCIVPGRGPTRGDADVFLPFEGDQTLAVILSKAFLLADDAKIIDRTITRQIDRA